MNNSLPELTPEQLRQLNAISGLQKTRRRGADASVPSALTAESESGEAPDISASYALPKPAPNMSEEDYERQIKEGLTEHIEAIYDRARQRADARRQETLARMDKGTDNASLWQQAWASYAKSQMLRSPSALGGEDTQLMQAAERALKILNQKTEKDKQAGDGTSGLTREIFDWQTLADFASLGTRELAENIVTTRALKKAARSERLTPTEKDIVELFRTSGLINEYIARRGGPTTGAKVGSGVAASLPYMAGFATTSGLGSGAAKTVGRALIKKEAKNLVGRGLRKLGEYTVSAAAMTPLQAGTYTNYHQRAQQQYTVAENGTVTEHPVPKYELMYKAAADSFTDVFTEHIGGELGKGVQKVLKWPVEQLGRRMGVKLSFDKLLPGYSRSRYLTDFRNRTLWNGPVDEWLEEVAGGILSPLLTGEHEQWRENLSGENLWTTFLTTSLMGAGFSALELPNVAAYVHKTHVLQTEEKKALAKIENEELRKQVFEAMHKPTMSQQAQAMAAIDWQAANIGKMDAAHAADYARFRLQRQILDGMETGDAEGEALHTAVQTAERWAYKGLDGKTATEEIITARRADGKTYVVLSGDTDEAATDGTLFVLDPETGQPGQIDRTELEHIERTPLAEFSARQAQIIEQQAEAENRAKQEQYDMETGTEAGIAPEEVARIVTPEAVQYANGDEVITADGVQGRITGKQGGSYVVQLDTGQFVLTPAHALTPKSEAPPPTETTTAIAPAQHNEATDTDTTNNEPIARQLAEAIRAAAGEQDAQRIIQRMLDGAADAGQRQMYSDALQFLQQHATATVPVEEHPTPVPAVPPPAAPARTEIPRIRKERTTPYTQSAAELGDFVSIEDVILRDIASGLRFAWKDSGNRRGLARELGFTGNENERRSRFSILSSDGITPEQYAERLYFQYGGGNTEQAHWDMDDKTIKDAVLEVLSRIHSPRQAYNAAVRLHNDTPNPYDDMDEEDYARMQEYEAEQERVRTELLYDDAFAQWAGQTSQDQWAEIDNLFIEDASESSKNTNFEATETAPPNPANYDDETENGNGIDTSAFGATGNDRSETVDGEQRNAPAGDDAYLGQQGGGSAAVRHGGGLDAISGPLTDDERRIAAETAAEIEARLDQYRAELHTLRTRYAAEKRNIGTAYEEDNQTTLFGPSHEPSDGDLFDVPRDFSDRNLNDILAPLQAEIGRLQERIARTEASKSKVIAEAVEAYHAQGTLPLREERQKEIPQNSTSAEDTFPPAITQEYDRYLHHAVASFPDKVFSVLNNDLIKAGFIRDVRRLAKKDVRAAIKLVAEANAAAQKYAGKPILTPRHSIHAELATLAESQHRTKTATSDTSAETGLFSPTEQTRHSKTGATLYSVKLAERIERNAFQSLKKRAKEHDGYYSSFTRSFLFDTPEDAEAFRGTAPTSDATRPTSEEQPAIQHPLFDKAALVPVDSYSPKAYNMYRFYSARAREGLGYKKQSIVQNDEARERFIDHIRKLAEQSADAAIRLVVEINKAAEQEEGKPVFPLQHSIYAELEEVHARQTAEKQQSETADDSASSAGTAPEYGAQNKLVTTEQYEELKRRMREKLGQLNAGFDPEILSIGAQMAAYHVEAGARRFADFSRRMIADLGDVIRPYLKPIYTAARQMPGMEEYAAQMDSYEQVEAFDMADLDKAEKTSQPTGTGAQYRLAGIYDMTGAVEKDTNETGNLRPEKNFRKDLERFSRAFADELGWEHETDRKGKTIYAQTNIAPAGGDGSFTLWAPETDLGIYVSVPVAPQSYDNRYGYSNNLKIKDIMGFGEPILWRLRNKEQTFLPNGHNRYAPADITVGELAELAKKELNAYLDNITAAKTLDHILQENQNTRNDERRENSSEKDYPAYGDGSRKDGALGTGILSAEKPVATVSGESGGIARFDRPDRNTGDAVAAGSTRTGRRSGSSGRVLLSTPPTVLLSGGAGTNTHQRKNDAGDHRHVEKGGESEVAKNTSYKNHVIERGHDLAPRGEVGKIKANLAAIRLIKEIEAEGREATPEEKAVLEQFSGWGGIPAIFKIAHPYHNELRELLTADEYEAARASTTTAFYTPPEVISSIWDMVERLGFDGGRILEPSAGIGHFFGLMPLSIRSKSDLTGIELDDLSGHILRALYPEAHIHIEGFEQQRIPNNSYSLVISNVPFGTFKVHDTFDRDLSSRFEIHDYFIAKSIRKLKPGGLGVFITSTATLDRSANLRNWVVNDGNADFIGAVRLNTGTFKNTAGTETSADIIIVRKRDEAGPAPYAVNMQSTITEREAPYERIIKLSNGKVKTEAATAHMNYNKYFHDNPQFMAGQMRFGFESGVEIRPTEQRCVPTSDIDQSRTLDSFISALPENIYTSAPAPATERIPQAVEAPNSTKERGLTIIDGKPYIVRFGQAVPADWNSLKIRNRSKVEALGDYLRLKSAITELLDAERNDLPNIEQLRAELNDAYATFTRRYGTLSRNTRISFLRDDVDFPSIAAIENDKEIVTPDGKKRHDIQRSDIFFRRMLEPTRELKADTPKDAIAVSLYRYGRLDMPYIAELLHIPQEDTEKELLAQELIYVNPVTGLYEERNEYLSGNVREKLEQAEQANENGQFDANIRALVKIIPMDIPLPLIKVSLGSTWIPIALYEQFFKETFNVTAHIAKTSANKYIAKISNEGNTVDTNMGIPQAPGSKLALDRMNKTQTYISRSEYDPLAQKEKRVKDPEAMTQAAMKQTELEERFEQWIKGQDKTTTDKLVEIYNRTFNSTVERQIDVSSFDYFPNATHTKKPREHQKIGVMRGLQGATLLAHEVGTGKTLTLITTAMEMRRLGIAQKPCIVVQRSTFNQFASEIKSLYPAARVLVPSEKDLTASQRQELFAKIAYNDWDIVVLYHSYLDAIPDAPERVNEYIDTLIAEKMQQLEEIEANSPDNAKRQAYAIKKQIEGLENKKITDKTVKEEEKLKAQARTRALRLLDRRTDETMTFEQLGIDALLVDEAHAYKKLGFTTNLQNIKGIDPAASQRAQSMRLKTSYILANKQNKNVVFATGTPISNTMAEMWTFLRYLLPKHELEQYEIADFDSFANNFGNIEESAEFATNGKFRVVERFASYSNVPELLAIWKKVAHTVLTEDVPDLREGVGTPRIEGGKPKDILLDQTPALRAIMRSIREILTQYDAMSGKEKRRNSHIPLVMFGLAKRAAIDVRLVNPALPDDPNSKVNHAVREVVEDLKATADYNGTVAVFCDAYQSRDHSFNLFVDMKRKFIDAGIPAQQVAIIHDYITDAKREALYKQINNGEVRIVLGTTEKLGIGVNMQERLHMLVNLDVPIRPMDYLQRIERYIREHHITGVLLGEHNADDFAMRVYGLLDDMGRAIIDRMGNDRLKAMRKYLALFDLQKLTDQESYRSIIDELVKTLPQETKEQIVRSMRKHLDFVLSDNYRTPLRRRTMKSERPLPENFKYASEYVEELLKKKRAQPEMAPPAGIEPTVIYDKRNWKSRQQLRFIDSTLPVERLQEEVVRRGGSIDDLTDIHKHLNHLTSIAKVAIDKYTKEYLDPILDQIAAIARETGMTETHIIDYITAESSLERQATGIAALSLDPRDAWNETLARSIVADFRRRAGEIPTQRLWQRINAANDRVLEILVEDGMLAPEHRKLIKGHGWDYYVPLRDYDYNYRDQKGEPVAFDAADVYDFIDDSAGPRPLRKVLHEAEGRIAKPRNPIAQMVNIGIGAIIAAKTNRARQSALRLVQNNSRNSEDLFRVDKVWLAKGIGNRWVTTTIDPAVEDIELSKAARKEIARLKKEMNAALQAHDDELADYLYNRIEETERFNIVREAESGSRFEHEGHLGHSYERQRNVECYVNGIRYVITFADPAVANAINQYNRLAIPKWLDDTVGNATRWLARAFTSRNPAFVAANFLRDVQHAALVHAIDKGGNLEGFVRNIPASMAAITRELRGKAEPLTIAETGTLDVLDTADRQELIRQFGRERVMDTLYDYFRENGGETGFVHSKDIAEAEKEIKRYVAFRTGRIGELLKATQRSERAGVWLSYAARKSGMQAIGVALENASRIAENTSRLATFTTSLEQGKSLLTAIDDAKNVTVNFNRRGTATRPLGMFYVFFNASVQGAAQVARIAMRNRKRFAQAVATLTAAGFLDSLLLDFFLAGSGGDGRDLAVTEYERHNHLIIPGMGKRGYLKIPLPQGFRAFFGIGTALHDLYRGKLGSEDAARMMLTMLYEDFSPVASPSSKGDATRVLIPTALTPWYDIWYAGEDAFGYPVGRRSYSTTANYPLSEMGLRNVNKAIYYLCRGINRLGGGDENTPAGLRKNGEIDPLLRGIFEYNPSHVEHVLTYYGGGMGKFIKDMVHTSQALFTGEEISSRDLPVINRFYGTARPENPAERYYTLRDRLTNIEAKYKRMGPALDRTDPAVQRNLQRIAIFKAHQTAVNKLRAILADTRPNTAAYDRLQEELNETMMNALNEDDHVTEY